PEIFRQRLRQSPRSTPHINQVVFGRQSVKSKRLSHQRSKTVKFAAHGDPHRLVFRVRAAKLPEEAAMRFAKVSFRRPLALVAARERSEHAVVDAVDDAANSERHWRRPIVSARICSKRD